MQLGYLAFAALVGFASGQMNLTATVAGNNMTSGLAQLVGSTDLANALDRLSNVTVLAPSNDAIAALLNSSSDLFSGDSGLIDAVLQYHILNGTYPVSAITNMSQFVPTLLTNRSYTNVTGGQVVQAVKIGNETAFYGGGFGNATIVQADLNFTGGVVHVVDSVLSLPMNISSTALAANLTGAYGALNYSNTMRQVDDIRDVTFFAPNNDAFQSIGSLLANASSDEVGSILGYHVVNGTVAYSTALTNGTTLRTLSGGTVTITVVNGTVFVNSAKVVTPDILVANGVIHVIDNVLNPTNSTATPSPSATTGAPAYTGASSASNVPFTSGQPTPSTTIASNAGPGPASTAAASSTSKGAAPMNTGAIGAAALFGGAAVLMNM